MSNKINYAIRREYENETAVNYLHIERNKTVTENTGWLPLNKRIYEKLTFTRKTTAIIAARQMFELIRQDEQLDKLTLYLHHVWYDTNDDKLERHEPPMVDNGAILEMNFEVTPKLTTKFTTKEILDAD